MRAQTQEALSNNIRLTEYQVSDHVGLQARCIHPRFGCPAEMKEKEIVEVVDIVALK